ncbi:MAG: gp58-like family protein, partial [Prevotella sp.]|nr:gp58-like family protein [Prevotella sp.]
MKQLIARGQVTVYTQKDAYNINQSLNEYIFPANNNGTVVNAVSFTSNLKVTLGDVNITDFTIGAVSKPAGFSAITVNNTDKSITYSVTANTTTLADSGNIFIPVVIDRETYTVPFTWAKAKAGSDANLLDWVADWNTGKTMIDGNSVIFPKLFAGVKNADGTLTGTVIGHFTLSVKNSPDSIATETIDGIYGFHAGMRTFAIDNTGSVQLGNGNQMIRYNAATGKIEFGSQVSLNWIGATYIDKDGIFTGRLSADTVNALKINASQITAGTIDAARINIDALKASLITAANINALTLSVVRGTIGGWGIDGYSIYRGTKNNTSGGYTSAPGSVSIGSNGIRGFKWKLDATGAGAIAGGNISWDANGNVTFGSSVSLNWTNAANNVLTSAKTYADTKKTEAINAAATDAQSKANQAKADAINTAATDATTKVNNIQIGGRNLITNTNKGTTGWMYTVASGTNAYSETTALNIRAVKSTCSAVSTGYHVIARSINRLLLKNNTQYTISFDIYCDFDTTLGLSIRNSNGQNTLVTWTSTTIQKQTWIKVIQTAVSNTDTATSQVLYITGFNAVGSVIFANLKLEEGNKATQWAPAFEDIDTSIAEAKTAGTNAQTVADAMTKKANDEKWGTKLTYIDANGIFTGTLSANTVNAVRINASQITSGTIDAARINVNAIKTSIITAANIDALTLNVTKGKIGGWNIGTDNISIGSLNVVGQTPIQIRSASSGSGTIYNGAYKPYGITLSWYQNQNAGHIGLGQILASGSTARAGFMGIQMMAWDGTEYFCLSANTVKSGAKEVYNRIAGWAFDNTRIWKNNVSLSADGSITNGNLWQINNNGSGRLANGNIVWDAAGNVTFGSSVSLNWTNAVTSAKTEIQNTIHAALGGPSYPKLTKIDSTGIYTGTLTAGQIATGTISADRIATNSITAAKLDAASIKSSIINTDYINGLSCTFVRGKIGGWTIGSDNISAGTFATGNIPIQVRSTSTGSGYVYSGQYKPYGLTMTWHQSSNAGHFVFGQVMSAGNAVKTGFIGIQMLAWDNTEYFCLSADSTKSGAKEIYNRIAGWTFDSDTIYRGTKNNSAGAYTAASGSVSIGSNGIRGFKWRLDSTGAGAVAGGNISWDAVGNVTFGSSVSLNWTNAANNALASAKTYADTKKTEAISAAVTDATTKSDAAKELAMAMASGKMLYRDPTFFNGNNSIVVYNNSGNGTVTITRTTDNNAPNDSKQVLVIKNTGTSSPNCGGFSWATATSYRKIFITKIIAKIPSGRNISYHSNSIGSGGTQKWLTPIAGAGDWCEYICKVSCGTSDFSMTHYFAITGAVGTTAAPVEWRIAYATVFDITSAEKYTTTIDANGIYTGTVKANQVLVDSALVVGGSAYNGSVSVRDAANTVKVTLDRNGITAVGGTIGSWIIASTQISKNSVILGADGTISNGTKWKLGNDGSGYVANGNVIWTATGAVTITGTVNATSGTIGGFTISGNILKNTASDTSLQFNNLSGASYLSINESASTLLAMRADSTRTAISIQTYATGARGISVIANAGSTYAIESYGPHQFGQRSGEKWNAPGVL